MNYPARLKFSFLDTLHPTLRFRPNTGRLWLDLIFLLIIGSLHHTVLPSLFGSFLVVDLMTPWLIACFVAQSLPRSALLGAVGAMILETHSAAPAGLYICAYWVIAVVLYLTRSTLSWRHSFPWIVTIAASELWVIFFEQFVIAVNEGGLKLDAEHVLAQVGRLIFAIILGLAVSNRLRTPDLEDEEV